MTFPILRLSDLNVCGDIETNMDVADVFESTLGSASLSDPVETFVIDDPLKDSVDDWLETSLNDPPSSFPSDLLSDSPSDSPSDPPSDSPSDVAEVKTYAEVDDDVTFVHKGSRIFVLAKERDVSKVPKLSLEGLLKSDAISMRTTITREGVFNAVFFRDWISIVGEVELMMSKYADIDKALICGVIVAVDDIADARNMRTLVFPDEVDADLFRESVFENVARDAVVKFAMQEYCEKHLHSEFTLPWFSWLMKTYMITLNLKLGLDSMFEATRLFSEGWIQDRYFRYDVVSIAFRRPDGDFASFAPFRPDLVSLFVRSIIFKYRQDASTSKPPTDELKKLAMFVDALKQNTYYQSRSSIPMTEPAQVILFGSRIFI